MKKTTAPMIKHANHQITIIPTLQHNGWKYHCVDCGVWVGWLSKTEIEMAEKLGLLTQNLSNEINNMGGLTNATHCKTNQRRPNAVIGSAGS